MVSPCSADAGVAACQLTAGPFAPAPRQAHQRSGSLRSSTSTCTPGEEGSRDHPLDGVSQSIQRMQKRYTPAAAKQKTQEPSLRRTSLQALQMQRFPDQAANRYPLPAKENKPAWTASVTCGGGSSRAAASKPARPPTHHIPVGVDEGQAQNVLAGGTVLAGEQSIPAVHQQSHAGHRRRPQRHRQPAREGARRWALCTALLCEGVDTACCSRMQ